MEKFPRLHPTGFAYRNICVLLRRHPLLKIYSFIIERSRKKSFLKRGRDIIIKLEKHSRNSIAEICPTLACTHVKDLSCNRVFQTRIFMMAWFTNVVRLLDMYIFEKYFLQTFQFTHSSTRLNSSYSATTSRLVVDPSTINSHAFLFGCAMTDRV